MASLTTAQSVSVVGTTSTTQSITLSGVTSGNALLVVAYTTTGTSTVSTVADGTNTYTKVGANATSTGTSVEAWLATGVTTTSPTVTVTWTASTAVASMTVVELSFLAGSPLDSVTLSNSASATTMQPSGTYTPATTFESAFFAVAGTSAITSTPSSKQLLTSSAMHAAGFGLASNYDPSGAAITAATFAFTQTTAGPYDAIQFALKAAGTLAGSGYVTSFTPGTGAAPVGSYSIVATATRTTGQLWPL